MKSRILLIGGVGAGKTTLKQCLMNEAQSYRKTQMLEFKGFFIDCPGEYLQMPTYYRVLIDASHRVDEVWALQDAANRRTIFPPNFAKVFNKPVVGIITKIDREDAAPDLAEQYLRQAGVVAPMLSISAREGIGIEPLVKRLEAFASDA